MGGSVRVFRHAQTSKESSFKLNNFTNSALRLFVGWNDNVPTALNHNRLIPYILIFTSINHLVSNPNRTIWHRRSRLCCPSTSRFQKADRLGGCLSLGSTLLLSRGLSVAKRRKDGLLECLRRCAANLLYRQKQPSVEHAPSMTTAAPSAAARGMLLPW